MHNAMVHIYYGDGKGKTSAAIGLGIRACGRGLHVVMARFLKGEGSGELSILRSIRNFSILAAPPDVPFFHQMTPSQKEQYRLYAQQLWNNAIAAQCDVVLLDELLDAMELGLIEAEQVVSRLQHRPLPSEIVITGHRCPAELLACADYVSEMKKHKHSYDKGIAARPGIEY